MQRQGHSRQLSVDKIRGNTTVSNTAGGNSSFTKGHHRKTSSVNSVSSNLLAEQYDRDRANIINSCFAKKINSVTGEPINQYFTHVRVIEDSRYPSSRPSKDSSLTNKKKRTLIVSFNKQLQQVQIHKARENSDSTFQIGRTWSMKELQCVEKDEVVPEGFLMLLGKRYYWETHTSKERTIFIRTLIKIFMDHFNGHVPVLKNWDLSLFYMDEQSYQRAVIKMPDSDQKQESEGVKKKTGASSENKSADRANNDLLGQSGQNKKPVVLETPSPQVLQTMPYNNHNRYASSASAMNSTSSSSFPPSNGNTGSSTISNNNDSVLEKPKYTEMSNNMYDQNKLRSPAMAHTSKFSTVTEETPEDMSPAKVSIISTGANVRYENENENENENEKLEEVLNQLPSTSFPKTNDLETSYNKRAEVISLHSDTVGEILEEAGRNEEYDMGEAIPFDDEEIIKPLNIDEDLNESLQEIQDNTPHSSSDTLKAIEIKSNKHLSENHGTSDEEDNNGETRHQLYSKHKNDKTTADADLSFEKGDEIRYSQTFHTLDTSPKKMMKSELVSTEFDNLHKYGAEDDKQEKQEKQFFEKENKETIESYDDEITLALLETVNWDSQDNVSTLLKKLNTKLNHTQYTFNKELSNISDISSATLSSSRISKSCDKIEPWLSFFSMELSSFSKDIEYVEAQNNYLQIESSNKKKLWKDLSQILNDVSIDALTLSNIKMLPINELNLKLLETSLSKLYTAINAINGDKNNETYDSISPVDDDYDDLSKMEALKELKQLYNQVSDDFISRSIDVLENKIFKKILVTQDIEELTKLLPYSSLTLFVKNISPEKYDRLISIWGSNVYPVYEKLCEDKLTEISELIKKYYASCKDNAIKVRSERSNSRQDSYNDQMSSINSVKNMNSLATSVSTELQSQKMSLLDHSNVESMLETWLDYKKNRKLDILKSYRDSSLLLEVIQGISYVQNLCFTYQNFITNFFHIGSDTLPFNEYIESVSSDERAQCLKEAKDLESDRDLANFKYTMVSTIFSTPFKNFFINISHLIKTCTPFLSPGVMFFVENSINQNLKNSDQEFMINFYNRFSEKLMNDWDQFISEQQFLINRATIPENSKDVMPIILNFTEFFFSLHQEITFLLRKQNLPIGFEYRADVTSESKTFEYLHKSYHKLSVCIMTLISKHQTSLKNLENNGITDPMLLSGETADGTMNSSASASFELDSTVSLLLNTNWLIETQSLLHNENITGVFMTSCKTIFDEQKEKYSELVLKKAMPKLYVFVTNASKISEDFQKGLQNGDPSKYAAYSQTNLSKIVSSYTSQDIIALINKIYADMMIDFMEFQTSLSLMNGSKEFFDYMCSKLWSNLQGVTVSFYLKLYSLIDKHYKGTEIKFAKNDIITAFTDCKSNFSSI